MSTRLDDSVQTCPACDATGGERIGAKNGASLFRCGECRTLYAARTSLNYDAYYEPDNLAVREFIQGQLDELFEGLTSWRQNNRLLDIGCGAGSLLQAARRAGWEAEGLEVSKPAAEHVRLLGFKIFCGELAQANYPSEYFDVVMASELVEHLGQPLEMVKEAARVLRPGGLLWATTPNGGSLSFRVLGSKWTNVAPPEHLQLFTVDGIRNLLRRAGFREIRLGSRSFNPVEIWHALRGGLKYNCDHSTVHATDEDAAAEKTKAFDRVSSSYRLNEAMLRNPITRRIKTLANGGLWLTGLGDTLRIEAVK